MHTVDDSPETNSGLFARRDESLRILKFDDYAEYLQSDLWAWIRSQLENDTSSTHCLCCRPTTGLVWHHQNYDIDVLVGNFTSNPPPIVRLCRPCHQAVHRDDEQWYSLELVQHRLEELTGRFENQYSDFIDKRAELPTKAEQYSEFDGMQPKSADPNPF